MSSRNESNVRRLFELWCLVSNPHGSTTERSTRLINQHFPESYMDEKTLSDIPAFAFPCEYERDQVEMYSFVLTRVDSKWRYGFCRYDPKEQAAMILITYLPWHDTFQQMLNVLAELKRLGDGKLSSFLKQAYNQGVPDSGSNFKVFYEGDKKYYEFKRPSPFELPSIPQNHNLNLYYNFAGPKNMIAVFAAMLAERRIIFTSRTLERLSSCIQAANAFLYPMVWQHIYVPLLPMAMKDYLSAPMPYLIGVPQVVLKCMAVEELGDVVVFDCDSIVIESPFDDVHAMPAEIVSQLKKQLSKPQELIGDRISKIFLEALVQLIGGYRDAVEFRGSRNTFNMEKFIATRPSNLRPFLTKMMQLQIFQQFIDERLDNLNDGLGYSDEFELAIARYSEKMKKRRTFLTNPAKSAVKSVKDSSRGFKTAYKDLKSKFTPHNSNAAHFHSHLNSNSHDRIVSDIAFGKTTAACHRSAPSSPVCGKRNHVHNPHIQGTLLYASPEALNGAQSVSRPVPSVTVSNASAHMRTKCNTGSSAAHSNGRQCPSPDISPASSSPCPSEMNLSQELQSHPLFKMPAVDRNLKPEHNNTRVSRTSGHPRLLHAFPDTYFAEHNHEPNSRSARFYYNQPNATQQTLSHTHFPINKSSMLMRAPAMSHAHMPVPTKISTTDSIFDNPPDMQSPPVPPRRQYYQKHNAHSQNESFINKDSPMRAATALVERARQLTADRSSRQNDTEQIILPQGAQRCSSSSNTSTESSSASSAASFASALSHLTLTNEIMAAPMPTPRTKKEKESLLSLQSHYPPRSQQRVTSPPHVEKDVMNDLISLDDSNNASFDLEDFDPLNKDARPMPPLNSHKRSTTLPPTIIADVRNQINPYYMQRMSSTPPPLPLSAPPKMAPPDNDSELLRKYGLDQFTVNAATANLASSACTYTDGPLVNHSNAPTTNGMNNWMTFD